MHSAAIMGFISFIILRFVNTFIEHCKYPIKIRIIAWQFYRKSWQNLPLGIFGLFFRLRNGYRAEEEVAVASEVETVDIFIYA